MWNKCASVEEVQSARLLARFHGLNRSTWNNLAR